MTGIRINFKPIPNPDDRFFDNPDVNAWEKMWADILREEIDREILETIRTRKRPERNPTTEVGVMGLVITDHKDGSIGCRCRGFGTDYEAFITWIRTKKVTNAGDDWPWQWWTFVDPADATEMEEKFGKHLMTREKE